MKLINVVSAKFHPEVNLWTGMAVIMGLRGSHENYHVVHNDECTRLYYHSEKAAKKQARKALNEYLKKSGVPEYKDPPQAPENYKYYFQQVRTPHRCPVCNGQGMVPNGFYLAVGVDNYSTSSITPEQCRSCNGTGVVWYDGTFNP